MFKAMLLQSHYNLSDPRLEAALARDIAARRFIGLGKQLAEKNLYVKTGAINTMDASVTQAQRNHANKNKEGNSTQDPEAGYSVKMGSHSKQKPYTTSRCM